MIIYKDPVSGDEILSDSYDLKEVGGVAYEVDCAMITVGGESFDTGANASAEEAEDGVDDGQEKVINIVHSFRLQEVPYDKKTYLGSFKRYLKFVTDKLKTDGKSDQDIKDFQAGVQAYVKNEILPNFKDFQFFVGESFDVENGLVVLLNYHENEQKVEVPYVIVWKHGLIEMKV